MPARAMAETKSLSGRRSRAVRALLERWLERPRYPRAAYYTHCGPRHLTLRTRDRRSIHISSISQPSVYALGALRRRTLARQRRHDQSRVRQRAVHRRQ